MRQQTSALQQYYRGFVFVLAFIAAVLIGIAFHMGAASGMGFFVVGVLLGAGAEAMAKPLRNPGFGCLLIVMAIVVMAIVGVL